MNAKVIITKETYFKDGKKWVLNNEQMEDTGIYTVRRIEDSIGFFRRLGGIETLVKGYTCAGYNPVKLTSTNPDKTQRTIRTFNYFYNEI
jgi:hypothetical protein